MRDLVLMVVVISLCVVAIFRARVGLLGYMGYAVLRPDAIAWSGPNRYSFFLALTTLLGSTIHMPHRLPIFVRNPFLVLLLLLNVLYVLSAFFAVDSRLAWDPLNQHLRATVMALLIPVLITTRKELKIFLLVVSGGLGLLGAKFGLWGLWHGGARFDRGVGGMMADNNMLALGFAMGLPLLWFCIPLVEQLWAKAALLSLFGLTLAALVMTFSRGGALAAATAMGLIFLRSRYKLLVLVLLALLLLPAAALVGDAYLERLASIATPTEDHSTYSRLVMWRAGLRLFADHPLLGVGFGRQNQQVLIGRYLPGEATAVPEMMVMHNTWIQLLADSGAFAFAVYVALLASVWLWLWRIPRKVREKDPPIAYMADALRASLAAFVVGSTFVSRVDFDLYYILLCAAIALYEILRPEPQTISAPVAATLAAPAPVPVKGMLRRR